MWSCYDRDTLRQAKCRSQPVRFRQTILFALHEDEATVLAKKAEAFQGEVLVAAVEHVALDKADTNVGEIKFSDCLKKRILKKADLSSYDFDEPVLLNSKF